MIRGGKVGHLVSAVLCFKLHRIAGFAGIFFGFGLIIWLFVQVNMIGGGSWLQYISTFNNSFRSTNG